jgi:hypothetical protein
MTEQCRIPINTEPELDPDVQAFLGRCGLSQETPDQCLAFAKTWFTDRDIRQAPFQGFCSYTLFVGVDPIVQFRPPNYRLDLLICSEAHNIFPRNAPRTEYLGTLSVHGTWSQAAEDGGQLFAYTLSRIPGISLGQFRLNSGQKDTSKCRGRLISDFARHLAEAWGERMTSDGSIRRGKVGSSLPWRVRAMLVGLPSRFSSPVAEVLAWLPEILALPWVLTHGDLVPANIMVDPETAALCGLVDWAEAEWLPFGVGLYGLEELLGEHSVSEGFLYYHDAASLRERFWDELVEAVPKLAEDPVFSYTVRMAHTLGILLWHGIAFDDGKLSRVVQRGRDNDEIQKLKVLIDEVGLHRRSAMTTTLESRRFTFRIRLRLWLMILFSWLRRFLDYAGLDRCRELP